MTRCKPGDLAIVIKSACGNEGRIVEVVRWVDEGTVRRGNFVNASAGWYVLGRVRGLGEAQDGRAVHWEGRAAVIPDEWLRPLRGCEGDDETLRWAGKPHGVSA